MRNQLLKAAFRAGFQIAKHGTTQTELSDSAEQSIDTEFEQWVAEFVEFVEAETFYGIINTNHPNLTTPLLIMNHMEFPEESGMTGEFAIYDTYKKALGQLRTQEEYHDGDADHLELVRLGVQYGPFESEDQRI